MAVRRRGRSVPTDVPFDRIAAALEAVTTARVLFTTVVGDYRGDRVVHNQGLVDFGKHLVLTRADVDGTMVEHLQAGPAVFHRLSAEERRQTGRLWRWEADSCPFWEVEHDQTMAAIRYEIARPVAYERESSDGEHLHHYSLLIRPGREQNDPWSAGLREHMHWHGTDRIAIDVWLAENGRLRRTRESFTVFRSRRGPGRISSSIGECWDFGVSADISPPGADEIQR